MNEYLLWHTSPLAQSMWLVCSHSAPRKTTRITAQLSWAVLARYRAIILPHGTLFYLFRWRYLALHDYFGYCESIRNHVTRSVFSPHWSCFHKELPPNDFLSTINQRRLPSPSWIRKGQSPYSFEEKAQTFEQTQPSRSPLKPAMKKEKKAIDWGGRFKAWTTKHATAIGSLTLVNALEILQ